MSGLTSAAAKITLADEVARLIIFNSTFRIGNPPGLGRFPLSAFSIPALTQVAMMATGWLHALWPVLPPRAQICTR